MRGWPGWGRRAEREGEFGFAVVGTGHGARKFLEGLRGSARVRVAAIVTRDSARGGRLAREFGVGRVCERVEELAGDAGVQAVYVAVPNALHREVAVRAAAVGKHVLCEKPLGISVEDCEAMIAAAAAGGVELMVGYRCVFDPLYERALGLVRGGALGAVREVESGFGFRAKGGWRLDVGLAGGGSMYDVGVYGVNAVRDFVGDFAVTRAEVGRDSRTGLEMAADWRGVGEGGVEVRCRSSYLEKIESYLRVRGERGWVSLEPAFGYGGTRLRGEYGGGKLDVREGRGAVSGFRVEAEHLAECVQTGDRVRTPGEMGLRDMRVIEEIYRRVER